jgi:hypothetical protein
MCVVCGADFVVEYAASTLFFGHCSLETPGILIWCNSDEIKCDDRDNAVELRRDVLPLPNTPTSAPTPAPSAKPPVRSSSNFPTNANASGATTAS